MKVHFRVWHEISYITQKKRKKEKEKEVWNKNAFNFWFFSLYCLLLGGVQ